MFRNFKNKFIGDRNFYRYILLLALPMIAQNAITSFVSFLDNIMVGRIGTEEMSGVAIVNQIIFVFNICVFGATSGAGIFGTQFYGKGDFVGQKHAFRIKVYAVFVVCAITVALFYFAGTDIISLYLSDASDVGDIELALKFGQEYMGIMTFGLIPFAISQIYTSTIRETGHTFVPMISGVVAMITNLILDVVLIFGIESVPFIGQIPALGVKGAAIATVMARIIECVIVVVWTHTHKNKNPYIVGAYRSFWVPGNLMKDVFVTGMPLFINEMLWALGVAAIAQCYAVRGLDVVAANNISSTITNLFNVVYIQLGSCISIVVGQRLGAGELDEAKDIARKMIFFSVICCVGIALIMMAVGRYFPDIYDTEEQIKELARTFIFISAVIMPVSAYCHACYFTLRSGGKTMLTFVFDSVFMWLIVIPTATFLAKYTTLAIGLVFFLVQSMEIIKSIIGFFMVKSGIWVKNIVDER
ncbi:MAG: MATE family efflux transporter [Lachnospiraceae bacterium]|nr:MATE family efflux transporter [Lachnospiraceae bacterium]